MILRFVPSITVRLCVYVCVHSVAIYVDGEEEKEGKAEEVACKTVAMKSPTEQGSGRGKHKGTCSAYG
jgi:hypothetical protein